MLSIRTYFVIAALIAAAAFLLGQFQPGAGMILVIVVTPMWVAYSSYRSRPEPGAHHRF